MKLTLFQWSDKAGYVRALERGHEVRRRLARRRLERQSLARRRLAGKLLRSLKLKADQWWYFLNDSEVPPDNNLAERPAEAVPSANEKERGGSPSMERFQHTANLLTVVQTCRRQGPSVIDFFEQSLMAIACNGE